jgi:hypothetical protein
MMSYSLTQLKTSLKMTFEHLHRWSYTICLPAHVCPVLWGARATFSNMVWKNMAEFKPSSSLSSPMTSGRRLNLLQG